MSVIKIHFTTHARLGGSLALQSDCHGVCRQVEGEAPAEPGFGKGSGLRNRDGSLRKCPRYHHGTI